MLYTIISQDIDNSLELRRQNRAAHLSRLEDLKQAGHLILAGPHPNIDAADPGPAGFTGSLVIAEFDSLDDAQQWANADPYLKAGVYISSIVKPFKHVLP